MTDTCEIIDQGTHLVVVNRNPARRNALTPGFYAGLRQALAQAADQPRVGAVVLTGAEGFFCAGGDLTMLIRAQQMTEDARRAEIGDLQSLVRSIMDCPRPVIAAVEGGAAGAGFSLAMACDLIIAADDARFTAAYVNAGLIPDGGLTGSLTAALPPALVAELCLGGQPVAATRLHALGAINAVTPPGQARPAAEMVAAQLAQGPAEAQAAIKALVVGARRALMDRQLDAEVPAMARALAAPEAAEGIAGFLEKRRPGFAALRRG
ncbi:oxepin-CoA hydrolase, alternative type [Paracoccus luteus]|uniref:oxepin-CoA hydrolase, alternative type n=1 Tax=Paracoccus luteus TaxID=2508543 RepID=UPI00106F14BD|nr:enoyl-CoA hydratase family protein [Paracoccus luteus]